MFTHTSLAFASRKAMRYATKKSHRFRAPSALPIRQTKAQRAATVREIMLRKHQDPGNTTAFRYTEQRLYSRGSRLDREGVNVNTVYALQGLGDQEPLRNSRGFGFSEKEALKFDSPQEAAKYMEPPTPFTPLAARKLAEGSLWPAAPEPSGMLSKEVHYLRHRSNMSPSAQAFTDRVAYHLRRSLKACPAHIGEKIDFAQLIIQEVIASRRSKELYIVWTTVDPEARFDMEPQLHRLNYWVQRLIRERIKTRPHIPHISWIYDGDRIERELPRELKGELTSLVGDVTSTLDSRVKYLKELDTVNQRMKDIPWFMPYLWSKEEKAEKTHRMRADLEEYDRRRLEASAAQKEAHKKAAGSRSVAPMMAPPPSYVR